MYKLYLNVLEEILMTNFLTFAMMAGTGAGAEGGEQDPKECGCGDRIPG